MVPLPIDSLLPEIVETMRSHSRLVLRAPPGAGKTTRVPVALLDGGVAGGKQVLVLEPRRIAARAAAEFVASERNGTVGGEIGYRVRFEQRGGPETRVWFVTQGVFSRSVIRDPYLDAVGVVVLDEFHERRLEGDVALGIVRELQETVRPDLKLLVMSATLEMDPLSAFLGGAPVLTSQGRAFGVEIEYEQQPPRARLPARVAAAVARALRSEPHGGDVLVFLPGAAAIRQSAEALAPLAEARGIDIVPLHGDLPLNAQRRAIVAGPRRRVVLSTNVAETSLTIAGVTTVVDSGLVREARFDPRRGWNRLEEVRISRASAEQRAGRAGRTQPGRCLRLWTIADHAERREREVPEALRLDLTAAVLELRAWGGRDLRSFAWLDAPREGALEAAERLLSALGAVEADGAPTAIGRRMLDLPAPPRLARMLVEAERAGVAEEGALAAALAAERDILLERRAFAKGDVAPWPTGRSDLLLRMDLLRRADGTAGLDPGAVGAVERARRQLARSLDRREARGPREDAILRSVLAGFPDRVVRRREPGSPRGVMVGGGGVVLDPASVVREAELFIAVDLDAGRRRERSEARVVMASAVDRRWLEEMFPKRVRTLREVVFDRASERIVARERELYEDLSLRETTRHDVDPLVAAPLLAAEAKRDPERALSIGRDERAFLDRVRFLAQTMPELGLPGSEEELRARAVEQLCAGKRTFAELRAADLGRALRATLEPRQVQALERDAPARLRLPSGRSARISYGRDKAPVATARIQDLFGLETTPRIASGRVPLVIEILAPNDRPVQVTEDLGSFWRRTYPEVRKQLRGRYPKHAWPESPFDARLDSRRHRR